MLSGRTGMSLYPGMRPPALLMRSSCTAARPVVERLFDRECEQTKELFTTAAGLQPIYQTDGHPPGLHISGLWRDAVAQTHGSRKCVRE